MKTYSGGLPSNDHLHRTPTSQMRHLLLLREEDPAESLTPTASTSSLASCELVNQSMDWCAKMIARKEPRIG